MTLEWGKKDERNGGKEIKRKEGVDESPTKREKNNINQKRGKLEDEKDYSNRFPFRLQNF